MSNLGLFFYFSFDNEWAIFVNVIIVKASSKFSFIDFSRTAYNMPHIRILILGDYWLYYKLFFKSLEGS